jgi:hypothetical protein
MTEMTHGRQGPALLGNSSLVVFVTFSIYQQQQQLELPDLQLSSSCQGRTRYGPLEQTVRAVHHSTIQTVRTTLLKLSWAGPRVGPALFALGPLCFGLIA